MKVTRRDFSLLSMAAPLLARPAMAAGAGEAGDWPQWAPTRQALYADIDRAVRRDGQDVRSFGAVLDGSTDDTAALERALREARVVTIPGGKGLVLRITRQVRIERPVIIAGVGGRPTIRAEGREKDVFLAHLPGDDPGLFLGPVRIDNLAIDRPAPLAPHGKVLRAYNGRGVSVTRCSARRMGIVGLHHTRQRLRQYKRTHGSIAEDPAVVAGFSENAPDDLCEDLLVFDCDVDGETHSSQLARFDFTRRVAVAHNRGRFASISWWGGGGRRAEGGDLAHLRRARDIYVCDNTVSGSIGGVYGNNGQNVHVARNRVSMVTDIGIDFEGCVDVVARDNIVENAGNYCYATLFAARNILFENNIGIQDGSATDIHLKYGSRKVGPVIGRALLALRSAGFAQEGAVTVAYRGNRFAWRGTEGFGRCLPSFFSELQLVGNRFENVTCDLAYRATRRIIVRENTFVFDRASETPVSLIEASAGTAAIVDNRVIAARAFPPGSKAIVLARNEGSTSAQIARNRIEGARGSLPIELQGVAGGLTEVIANTGAAIIAPAAVTAAIRDNLGEDGKAAPVIRPVPEPVPASVLKPLPEPEPDQE